MAPKAKAKADAKHRASSPGPKAKAKGKAAPAEDPRELAMKEGGEMFDTYQDGGVIKLKQFADCIRAVNEKKSKIWGDEPGPKIKDFWKTSGGQAKKELTKEDIVAWWPDFLEAADARLAEFEAEQAKIEEDKVAKEKQMGEEKVVKAAQMASMFEGTGIWKIPMTMLNDATDEAYKRGKTPLFLDDADNHPVETYFVYSNAHIVECKKMIMDKAKGAAVDDVLDEQRNAFFAAKCFKFGKQVVFRMANTACDIKGTFNSEIFPTHKLLDAKEVQQLWGVENADKFKGSPFAKMCPTDEILQEFDYEGVHEKFRVVVVTQFKEEDYEEFLKDMFPMDLVQPILPQQAA